MAELINGRLDEFYKKVADRAYEMLNFIPAETEKELSKRLSFSESYSEWEYGILNGGTVSTEKSTDTKVSVRRYKVWKRTFLIAAIIIIFAIICSVGVGASKQSIYEMTLTNKKGHSTVTFDKDEPANTIGNTDSIQCDIPRLGYIPEGYEIERVSISNFDAYFIAYSNGRDIIYIDRSPIEGVMMLDNDGIEITEYKFHGKDALYGEGSGGKPSFFIIQRKSYTYSIFGRLPLDELLKIAENITEAKSIKSIEIGYVPENYKTEYECSDEYYHFSAYNYGQDYMTIDCSIFYDEIRPCTNPDDPYALKELKYRKKEATFGESEKNNFFIFYKDGWKCRIVADLTLKELQKIADSITVVIE